MTGTLKEKILTKLEKSEKNYVSGGQLAESLGVSRTAVWKAICSLREEGYVIEATTNRGYRLEEGSDILSAAGIAGYMRNGDISGIHVFREVDSTNNEAKSWHWRERRTELSWRRKSRRPAAGAWDGVSSLLPGRVSILLSSCVRRRI